MKQEHTLQAQVCRYLRLRGCMVIDADVMLGLVYLPVNHPSRFAFVNAHKMMGYTKGQPDLIVLMPSGKVIFAEMKAGKKGVQKSKSILRIGRANMGMSMLYGARLRIVI